MKFLTAFIMTFFTSLGKATVLSGTTQDCPIQFEGRVRKVIEPSDRTHFFAKKKVVLEKIGEEQIITFDVLSNGPFQVDLSKEYRVHLREGKLCWMEEI